jgi:ribosomal protein L37AE/L43A
LSFAVQKVPVFYGLGDIIEAKCECGFSAEIFVGGGKFNFKTYCGFPFYCNNCKTLYCGNYLKEEWLCKNCNSSDVLPYNNDSLREHTSNKVIFGWNVNEKRFELTDDNYLCPSCHKFSLKFSSVGNWD